jgi:hypothetical protein
MTIARRQFVKLTFVVTGAAMTGAAGALASACSSSDEDPKTPTPSGNDAASGADTSAPKTDAAGSDAAKDSPVVYACRSSISQNHGHTVTVPVTDLDSSTAKTYAMKGTADHSHDVVLEPQDLADLKAGLSVKKTSNFAGQTHDHDVNILCATI